MPFAEHVRRVGADLAGAQDHSDLTFGSLIRRLRLPRDRDRTPLVETTFTIDKIGAPFDFGDVTIASVDAPKNYANFDLQVNAVDSGSDVLIECDYNADLFDGAAMGRWLSHYETLLRRAVARPDDAIVDLPMLDEDDKRTILDEWNDTAVAFPDEKRLHRLFEAQVRRTPDAVALVTAEERSLRRAQHPRQQPRPPAAGHRNRPRGDCRSVLGTARDLIAALLAVLKAGALTSRSTPPTRRIASRSCWRTRRRASSSPERTSSPVSPTRTRRPSSLDDTADVESSPDLEDGAAETDLAYVIYTSGSTGVPKGVAIEHRSAGTLVHWAQTVFSDQELSGVLASTSVCFDLSVFEIFVPLAFGGRVILATATPSRSTRSRLATR